MWRQFRLAVFLVAFLGGLATVSAEAQDLRVAAASDLQGALPELLARFQTETGVRVQPTFGSSGNFYAQIRNGAPFDVYLSADIDYPRRLQAEGFAEAGTLIPYAIGRLVLWARHDSGIDVTPGLPALLDPRVRRIAIANPVHAPYGRAAVAALRRAGLYEKLRDRFVLGENITQTAQFAHSGNVDAGLIALSHARGPTLAESGSYVEIPASLHPPIEQGAIVVKASRHVNTARQFLAFLQRPDTVAYLKSAGFEPPAR